MTSKGRLRLAVNVTKWEPNPQEFQFLCTLLPAADSEACNKFRFFDDKKRALVSRLLQRHAAFMALDIPHEAVIIERTKGRKPYVANNIEKLHAPNYNYSVSHEGNYVVLASEDICVCGCDVAAPHQLRRNAGQPLADVLAGFTKQLTPDEWATVRGSPLESEVESRFRKFWSLKEAFVKATGEGLGFDLGRCAFQLKNDNKQASVAVDGVPQPSWTFHLHELGQDHCVSVARAPIPVIVDAWGGFKATLQLPNVPNERHSEALTASEPPFTMLRVADLISESRHAEYEAAGGDLL
ncbi:hypothetical protein Ndes2526B_g02057 [Nannochloris sp. 'desiccata']|nr:putative L-aminoadipate-semialdehyde dehydrogenase-phosphopantetheinyl transferase [Chlorella desiccata (nom. nud.)]